jgi:hypothetical protein
MQPRALDRRSRALMHWRARDLSLTPLTRQVPTFTRASANGAYADRNGVLFTPGHSQPRFAFVDLDGDGVRETAVLLFEEQRSNGMLWSEQFDNAAWNKSLTTITPNATYAPDGTLTADKLVETVATGFHEVYQSTPCTNTKKQAPGVFVKAAERTWVVIFTNATAGEATYLNLATGALGNSNAGHAVRVEPFANGWYRLSVVHTATAANVYLDIAIATGNGVANYAGDGTSGIYIWGGQVDVDQCTPSTYIKTTNAIATRQADTLTFPFPQMVSQEYTVLVDAVDLGAYNNAVVGAVQQPLWSTLTDAYGGGVPYINLLFHPSFLYWVMTDGAASPNAYIVYPTSVAYKRFEARAQFANRIVRCGISISGGAEVLGDPSAQGPDYTGMLWQNQIMQFAGSNAGQRGMIGLIGLKIVPGARSIDEMRQAF